MCTINGHCLYNNSENFRARNFVNKIFNVITNQKTQRQTEAVVVTIIRPQERCEHSITNWDQTAFLHPSILQSYSVYSIE